METAGVATHDSFDSIITLETRGPVAGLNERSRTRQAFRDTSCRKPTLVEEKPKDDALTAQIESRSRELARDLTALDMDFDSPVFTDRVVGPDA